MTKAEFASIAAAMRTYYPREPLFQNEHATELWFEQLGDLSAPAMQSALKFWVKRNKYSPSIADLLQLTKDIQDGRILDWNELTDKKRAGVVFIEDKKQTRKEKELEDSLRRAGAII